jgi:hypothetical protein
VAEVSNAAKALITLLVVFLLGVLTGWLTANVEVTFR